MADQLFLTVQPKPFGRGSTGNNQRPALDPVPVDFQAVDTALLLELLHDSILKARAKALGLGMHPHDQVRPVDSFRKTGEIFHRSRGCELPAGLATFENQWGEIGPRCINGGGQSSTSGPDDNYILHKSAD